MIRLIVPNWIGIVAIIFCVLEAISIILQIYIKHLDKKILDELKNKNIFIKHD